MNKNASGSKVTAHAGTVTTVDTAAERKLENATEGLPSRFSGLLQRMFNIPANNNNNRENALTICDYIQVSKIRDQPIH